eukprot:8100497-Prorocentrum_lima.AAC.1
MTSSLVGSEMCIRDSSIILQPPPARRRRRCHAIPARRTCPLLLHTLLPVSYTHLTLPTICSV